MDGVGNFGQGWEWLRGGDAGKDAGGRGTRDFWGCRLDRGKLAPG